MMDSFGEQKYLKQWLIEGFDNVNSIPWIYYIKGKLFSFSYSYTICDCDIFDAHYQHIES